MRGPLIILAVPPKVKVWGETIVYVNKFLPILVYNSLIDAGVPYLAWWKDGWG